MKMYHLMISEAKKLGLFGLLICCFLVSCKEPKAEYELISGEAQGTTFQIVYAPTSAGVKAESIDSLFTVIDNSMSLWVPESVISKVNLGQLETELDPHFVTVFNRSKELYNWSDGLFDPTVRPLLSAWGLVRKEKREIPTSSEIDSLKEFIGLQKFSLDGNLLSKEIPNATLDFNALAQGYTVDVLACYLDDLGCSDYLIEVGGELRSKGRNREGAEWRVGIEKPDYNQTEGRNALETIVKLNNASLATSGSYRKYVELDGKKYSHTINPTTGMPVDHQMLSVSVIAPNAMDADAYATYFMIVGKDKALELAPELGLKIQCLSEENGKIQTAFSEGFEELIVPMD
ncbi:FAD:protein FMN transferase [Jiulongibacter sp. NS-SX5]|uniref:FAD:protein FMN transferase n=1 Tax=Jiulongibacter sp. NS-SX5 TaxID=3463854 RepID=UPI004058F428